MSPGVSGTLCTPPVRCFQVWLTSILHEYLGPLSLTSLPCWSSAGLQEGPYL